MENELVMERIEGSAIADQLAELAALRIRVFREFPYLYDGSLDYEKKYLAGMAQQDRALIIRVQHRGRLVGAGTALPLTSGFDILEGALPHFRSKGFEPERYLYYSEILIDKPFRGVGVSREIYRMREAFAREQGFSALCFAAVLRDEADPRRPSDYFSPESYWRRMGFEQRLDMCFEFEWPTLQRGGGTRDEPHRLAFWLRDLEVRN